MELTAYPIPRNKSKRGMHWSASQYPEEGHWQDNLAWCADMGAGFVKFVEDGGGSGINVYRECWHKHGMIPIVRFYIGTPGQCGPREADAIKRISDVLGFRTYFELCNEPDLPIEWGNHRPTDWLQRSINAYCDYAPKVYDAGGLPGTFALASGALTQRRIDEHGNVLDPVDFNFIKAIIDQLGGPQSAQAIGLWLSMHNYTINHPIDYPYDAVNQTGRPLTVSEYNAVPAWAWDGRAMADINAQRARDQNPGATIWTDDTCFNGFLIFLAHMQAAGIRVPMITTEGGPTQTRGDDGRYAKVTEDVMLAWLPQMYEIVGQYPEYFAHCHWLLYNTTNGWEADRWRWGSQSYERVMALLKSTPVGAWGEAFDGGPLPIPDPIPIPEPEEPPMPEVKPVPALQWNIPPWNDAHNTALTVEGWQLIKAEMQTDNDRNHTAYIVTLDNNGLRTDIPNIEAANVNGDHFILPKKTAPDLVNQPLNKNDTWSFAVSGMSAAVYGVHTRYSQPDAGGQLYHWSYKFTFQYGLPAGGTVEPPPDPDPTPIGDPFTVQDRAALEAAYTALENASAIIDLILQRHPAA
jgi:hypothetical protein